jgi:hypothetical protein
MRRLFLILSLLLSTLLISSVSWAETKLEATIFSYDGSDFVRTETTLMAGGQSEAHTKLDHNSPAYKALVKKHSYTGPTSLFWPRLSVPLRAAHQCRRQVDQRPVCGHPEIASLIAPANPDLGQ